MNSSLLVTNKFIKDTIYNNKNYFNKIMIDEQNNYAYYYNYTEYPTYQVKISDKENYENKIQHFYNTKNDYNKIQVYYDTKTTIVSYILENFYSIFIVYYIIAFIKFLFVNNNDNINSFVFSNTEFTIIKNVKTRFNDVIGLKTIKQDLRQYIDMIKNREKYLESGAKIPRGLLMTGPPGTGKTLLAKALAGETGTSFISVSGSDFIDTYVGVGAKRVNNLFNEARNNSPCIVFIDEIDSMGRKRSGKYGGHSEQGSTLNKLLCEMDGFKDNENIMIIAATNMKSILDKALTRSGRFDRNIIFENPNINERKDLFKLYLNKIKLSVDMKINLNENCKRLAKMTGGLSGADIANISNQSIIIHLKNNELDQDNCGATFDDIEQSIDEVMIGMKKTERLMTDKEKKVVAHHEAGHALVSYLLKHTDPPVKVSIIPRGEAALGFSQQEPKDKKLYTQEELNDKICVLLGGRVAEEIIFNEITTGASDDIEKITNIAYTMVSVYGMSSVVGHIYCKLDESTSNKMRKKIDIEVKKIINKNYKRTIEILTEYKNQLIIIAEHLLKTELLLGDDIQNLIDKDNKLENSI
jgi:ATP-dependent metalloprotease FtsH